MNLDLIEKQKSKVILQFAIPSIIAMVLTSLINIVDGFFIGNYIGAEGLAAVNLGLPIVYLYLAIGLMISVGGISIAGRLLGAKDIKKANEVFSQTMVVCVVVLLVLTLIMLFSLNPISKLFHTDTITTGYFKTYYGILLLQLPLMVLISSFGMFIRGEGNPVFVMLSNLLAVVLNFILDYLFIARFSFGIEGIAWASVISTALVLLLNIVYILRFSKIFHFGSFAFDKKVCIETFFNGSSEFIGELAMCISMAAYNFVILGKAGVDGLAAFTIIGYVSFVFSMIIVGFGQGIVPIVSYAYGAGEKVLARKVRNTTSKMVVGSALVVFIVMSFLASKYCALFTDNQVVSKMVIFGLRLQMSSFAFAGLNTIASFYFTAIGKAKESAIISASRGLVVLLICIFVLSALFGINGVWLVSLVTEIITLIFSLFYIQKDKKI
jgi:putative MATE family efflux protein